MPDPTTTIVAELMARLASRDFAPFSIVLSDGGRIAVPTADHCLVTRILRRVEVEHDDGSVTIVNPMHITRLEVLHKPAA